MKQIAAVFSDSSCMQLLSLPAPENQVLPGVVWGKIEQFPSPAYWYYRVLSNRELNNTPKYRLGESFIEEVCACLLGGYGIPAYVGLAAFHYLKSQNVFSDMPTDKEVIFNLLSKPLQINGKKVKYRFAKQKSYYLAEALKFLKETNPPFGNGKQLRNWLLQIQGIGYKTASWIARNWLDADDVAILDVHILRAGRVAKFFDTNLTVEKNYLKLEEQFLEFAQALGVRTSELDATIWYDMMLTTNIFRKRKSTQALSWDSISTENSNSHSKQIRLF
ncbi:8-oxoguanine DNA glycosylase [Aggregatibacter actinomycetemcomitans]|uniref:8-oxoguanine DNA glycosylase n=1 Tax=Aggregatibacter actinomycetemcomitans TaxID=714 RepID=UPI001E65CACB|nr:8-oxoguanine DNA glycosylase [Aggregatibacter actinomycetemcomitans]